MIKSYTDLEQSKKLAVFLPLESADMIWILANPDLPMIKAIAYEDSEKNSKYFEVLPAWSLAALLSVLDFPCLTQINENEWEVCAFDHDNSHYFEKTASNPVDACVAMIEKLHERKIL